MPDLESAAPALESVPESALTVQVLYTGGIESTRTVLESAAALARNLHASVHLIIPYIVDSHLDLSQPPVKREFLVSKFTVLLAGACRHATVDIHFCRDAAELYRRVLPPRSLVVMGGRSRRWFPNRDVRLWSKLTRLGHQVIWVEASHA